MARKPERGARSFQEFLKAAPSLDEAASDDSVELTGLVSRTTEGRFAITVDGGQTYELDVEDVRDFREEEVPGAASAATIRVGRDVVTNAVLRPAKPVIKDMIKDPIKDIIHDGKHMITDPIVDHKSPLKDVHKDPLSDPTKPVADPPKLPWKDMHKDPLSDPHTFVPEGIGTGPGDPIGPDPRIDPSVNFAAAQAAPFVMATPHQAPQHLLDMQAGIQPGPNQPKRVETLKEGPFDTQKEAPFDTQKEGPFDTQKEVIADTHKELIVDTHKEVIVDTHKELVHDTRKEMVWDHTFVEGGPNTLQEGFDPGQIFGRPGPGFGPGV